MNLQGLFGKRSTTSTPPDHLSAAEAFQRQTSGALLVDVREREEWDYGHASGARHIPLGQLSRHLARFPKDRDLLFICQSGSRSNVAMQLAKRAGLARTLNVKGGMNAWLRAGLPTE